MAVSDPVDALAVCRAALAERIETLPAARLAGPELDVWLLGCHRKRLVRQRAVLICTLRPRADPYHPPAD